MLHLAHFCKELGLSLAEGDACSLGCGLCAHCCRVWSMTVPENTTSSNDNLGTFEGLPGHCAHRVPGAGCLTYHYGLVRGGRETQVLPECS